MTGPEHYREAERLLALNMLARAQVHATLAGAAATAMSHWNSPADLPMPLDDRLAWLSTASEQPAANARRRADAAAEAAEFSS
jgi:hypothetical protein